MEKRNFIAEFQKYRNLHVDGKVGPDTINALMEELEIESKVAFAHFYVQAEHESGHFIGTGRESLNYKPEAIISTFNRKITRFTKQQAELYGRTSAHPANQEMIANIAYGNRMGNGAPETGDGFKYRGLGPIQLTGADNIRGCLVSFGYSADEDPNVLLEPKNYIKTGKYFFDMNKLWVYCKDCSSNSVLTVSKAVNLGNAKSKGTPIGMDLRYNSAEHVFGLLGLKYG